MQIKLNRGPMKNKRFIARDGTFEWQVQKQIPVRWDTSYDPTETTFPGILGSYYRSNVILKDGTVVFEWMGWIE